MTQETKERDSLFLRCCTDLETKVKEPADNRAETLQKIRKARGKKRNEVGWIRKKGRMREDECQRWMRSEGRMGNERKL